MSLAEQSETLPDQAVAYRVHGERALFERAKLGDASARDALVARYLRLAKSIARRYTGRGEPYDDLVQVASLGLVVAIDRFDPDRGRAFSSYAVPTIIGELKRHFRDKGWSMRVPRRLQEQAALVERRTRELTTQLGRSPTLAEVAAEAGLDEEQTLEARAAWDAYSSTSLQALLGSARGDGTLEAIIGREDAGFERAESRALLARASRCLTPRDRRIVHLRYFDDLTQDEIAKRVGLSQMQVSRILTAALTRMQLEASFESELSPAAGDRAA